MQASRHQMISISGPERITSMKNNVEKYENVFLPETWKTEKFEKIEKIELSKYIIVSFSASNDIDFLPENILIFEK